MTLRYVPHYLTLTVVYQDGSAEVFDFNPNANSNIDAYFPSDGEFLTGLPGKVEKLYSYDKNVNDIVVILDNGECWGVGTNGYCELGDGTKIPKDDFVKIMDDVAFYSNIVNSNRGNRILQRNGSYWEWDSTNPLPAKVADNVAWLHPTKSNYLI